jgi:hypothetical protein
MTLEDDRRDLLRLTLEEARAAAAAVPGPRLGDRAAPLEERVRTFSARLKAFRAVMLDAPRAPTSSPTRAPTAPIAEDDQLAFGDLIL